MTDWIFELLFKKKTLKKIDTSSDSQLSTLTTESDDNNLHTILLPEQYNILWGTSWMTLFSSMYAIKKNNIYYHWFHLVCF